MAIYLTKLACELPDLVGRSLSLWSCAELARTMVRDGIVETISPQTVQRILDASRLKPWRVHFWLSPKVPRDEAFRQLVLNLCDLYTREPNREERIVSLDELTSIQPRTRSCATKPAWPEYQSHHPTTRTPKGWSYSSIPDISFIDRDTIPLAELAEFVLE